MRWIFDKNILDEEGSIFYMFFKLFEKLFTVGVRALNN